MSRKILCIPEKNGITQHFASKCDIQRQIAEYLVVDQKNDTRDGGGGGTGEKADDPQFFKRDIRGNPGIP